MTRITLSLKPSNQVKVGFPSCHVDEFAALNWKAQTGILNTVAKVHPRRTGSISIIIVDNGVGASSFRAKGAPIGGRRHIQYCPSFHIQAILGHSYVVSMNSEPSEILLGFVILACQAQVI